MKVKEIRKIDFEKVRAMCISNDLYSCGTNEEYEHLLLHLCNDFENQKTEDLIEIALNILNHSETTIELTSILFMLANECCYTVFEVI